MPISRRALLVLALSTVLFAGGSPASAQECLSGCVTAAKACAAGARSELMACRADCRANAPIDELRSCLGTCRQGFYATRGECRDGAIDCLGECDWTVGGVAIDPETAACLGDCGQSLGACAEGVLAAAKGCVASCETAEDRMTCLGGCAIDAKAGSVGCGSDFHGCTAACTGSPTTTLPPPPTLCFEAGAPTCGGTCIFPWLACAPVDGERCGCVLAN